MSSFFNDLNKELRAHILAKLLWPSCITKSRCFTHTVDHVTPRFFACLAALADDAARTRVQLG
jgi:hypothetical protein